MGNSNPTRKLKALQQRISLIEALSKSLVENPEIASRSYLTQLGNTVGLNVEDKAPIRPGGRGRMVLRLERDMEEDWADYSLEERTFRDCPSLNSFPCRKLSGLT